jgi:hypothetical protein
VGLNLENAVPMRWPSGALEIARREKSEGFGARARQALERWHQPAALEILQDTPVDSLILSWAAGLPADAEQWRTAAPLIAAAQRRNLSVIGWIEAAADHRQAMAAARSAGLAAVAMRDFKGSADVPVIAWSERAGVPWDSAAPAVAITDNVWPGVNITNGGGDANAGPTSLPWLDSNGWYIQMARARLRAPLWVAFDPPAKGAVVPAQSYVNAITDSEVAGGRWLISLDDDLRASLAGGAAPAIQSWKQIAAAARFFQEHAEWKSYRSLGLLGVISDFTGADFELSGEILNLMARRDLIYRIIWKSQAAAQPFTGLKALVYADAAAPDPALRRKLTEFVQQGGLLVTGPEWGAQGKPAPPDFDTQFDVRGLGKGRLAVARQALTDPYQVAVDTQFLLSHRYDLVKIYNAPSSGCTRFTASADGSKALLQCLSYANAGRGGGGLRTIWVREQFPKTRLWAIGSGSAAIAAEPSEEFAGVEYHLPETAPRSYLALEFEAPDGRATK